jgi:hypothetical protein
MKRRRTGQKEMAITQGKMPLLRWNWNLEKSIATGTHNSEPLDHLERRLAAPAVKREAEEDCGR